MSNLSISITYPSTIPSGVVELKRWGDPILTELTGWTTGEGGEGRSNFQHIDFARLVSDTEIEFGAVTGFQRLDEQAEAYLRSLQYPEPNHIVDQKMGWLVGGMPPGRPYWITDSGEFRFGTMAFGGQKLLVETTQGARKEYLFHGKYPGVAQSEWIVCYKLIGLRRADWGKYTHATAPWFVQRATAAYSTATADDVYIDKPRGEIFHVVWSPLDYPANVARGGELYMAKAFCV